MIAAREEDVLHRKQEMLDSLPIYYNESPEANAIMLGNALESERKKAEAQDLLDQLFVATATWGLDYWDRVLDLTTNPRMPIAKRRERILVKLNGAATATVEYLTDLLNVFANGASIEEFPREYRFEGYLPIDQHKALNLTDIYHAVNEVKPAHLVFHLNALIRETLVVSGRGYSFIYPFPITNCFTTADVEGAITKSGIEIIGKSYSFFISYPITNELMPIGNNLMSKSNIVLGVHTDVYSVKLKRAGESLLGQNGLIADPAYYSERSSSGEINTGEVTL